MIRSVLKLRTAPGRADALEDFYARHGILERAQQFEGCHDAMLLRSNGEGAVTHLVVADWDSAADYRRWVDDPWRAAVSGQLADLLDTGTGETVVGELYEFVPPR